MSDNLETDGKLSGNSTGLVTEFDLWDEFIDTVGALDSLTHSIGDEIKLVVPSRFNVYSDKQIFAYMEALKR